MGVVSSYFFTQRKAQTSGLSPSPTDDTGQKVLSPATDGTDHETKSNAPVNDEKPPEEPESNDTSYGVEATAVRTLAASTGTVAILGTTAKVKDANDINSDDPHERTTKDETSCPSISVTEPEPEELEPDAAAEVGHVGLEEKIELKDIKPPATPEKTNEISDASQEINEKPQIGLESTPSVAENESLKEKDSSEDKILQENPEKTQIERKEIQEHFQTGSDEKKLSENEPVLQKETNVQPIPSLKKEQKMPIKEPVRIVDYQEKKDFSLQKKLDEKVQNDNDEKHDGNDNKPEIVEKPVVLELQSTSDSKSSSAEEEIKITGSRTDSPDNSKTEEDNEISSEQLKTNSLSDMSLSEVMNSEGEEAAREAAKAQELKEMVASLSATADQSVLDYDIAVSGGSTPLLLDEEIVGTSTNGLEEIKPLEHSVLVSNVRGNELSDETKEKPELPECEVELNKEIGTPQELEKDDGILKQPRELEQTELNKEQEELKQQIEESKKINLPEIEQKELEEPEKKKGELKDFDQEAQKSKESEEQVELNKEKEENQLTQPGKQSDTVDNSLQEQGKKQDQEHELEGQDKSIQSETKLEKVNQEIQEKVQEHTKQEKNNLEQEQGQLKESENKLENEKDNVEKQQKEKCQKLAEDKAVDLEKSPTYGTENEIRPPSKTGEKLDHELVTNVKNIMSNQEMTQEGVMNSPEEKEQVSEEDSPEQTRIIVQDLPSDTSEPASNESTDDSKQTEESRLSDKEEITDVGALENHSVKGKDTENNLIKDKGVSNSTNDDSQLSEKHEEQKDNVMDTQQKDGTDSSQTAAAITIQSSFRGFMARKQMKEDEKADEEDEKSATKENFLNDSSTADQITYKDNVLEPTITTEKEMNVDPEHQSEHPNIETSSSNAVTNLSEHAIQSNDSKYVPVPEPLMKIAQAEVDRICQEAEKATESFMTPPPMTEDSEVRETDQEDSEEFPAPPDDLMDPSEKNEVTKDHDSSGTQSTEPTVPLGSNTDGDSSKTEDTTAPSLAESEIKSNEPMPSQQNDDYKLESSFTENVNTEVAVNRDSTEGELTMEEDSKEEELGSILQSSKEHDLQSNDKEERNNSTDSGNKDKAAVIIQAGYRGFKTRKDLKKNTENGETSPQEEKKDSMSSMQELPLEKHEVNTPPSNDISESELKEDTSSSKSEEELNESAKKIQAGIRGYLVRKDQKVKRDAAVKIQSHFRGFKTRQRMKQESP